MAFLPLSGVRVVEIAHMVSIPAAARILLDLGASVVKIEPPSGDITRHLGPRGRTTTALFHSVNRGKTTVEADVRTAAGRQQVLELVAEADVLLTNLDEKLLTAAGFDESTLAHRFPELILVRMHGGENGRSTDGLAQCATGLTTVTGSPDRGGFRTGAAVVDVASGLWAVVAVLAALQERQRPSGGPPSRGRHVTIALDDAATFLQLSQLSLTVLAPQTGFRRGNHSHLACTPMLEAADGRVAITILNDRHWHDLCAALGRADLRDDPRFVSTEQRQLNQAALEEEVRDDVRVLPREHLVRLLAAAAIPVAAERSYEEFLAWDGTRGNPMIEYSVDEPGIPLVRLPIEVRS